MKKRVNILLIFHCLATTVMGQKPVDLSAEISKMLEGSPVPSLAAAAVLDGRIVSAGASGLRKKGHPTKVTIQDKYHLGSCTKSMTATLGAILVMEGKLKWNTTVTDVFKDMAIHEQYRGVTLKQLLNNTGGVPGDVEPILWKELWQAKGSPREQRMQMVKGILSKAPGYPPGRDQVYSNAGFSIAGAMMEEVANEAYESMLKKKLFVPLSMNSAGFRAPATNGKIDQPYGHSSRLLLVIPVDPEPRGDNPRAIAPAGAVHCSILDFARYAQLHLGSIEDGILSKDMLQTLHTPSSGKDYAMGWVVTERKWAGGRAFTHAGSNTMFYSVVWLAPNKRFGAVALCNVGSKEGFKKCDEVIGFLIQQHLK